MKIPIANVVLKLATATGVLGCLTSSAGELEVAVSPIKLAGQKALVKLEMVNHLTEPVTSAKAACFICDDAGKVVAQNTRWVFGGGTNANATIPVGGTNVFHFVVNATKPWTTTNLTAKVVFSRVVLQDGHLADVAKSVSVFPLRKQ
ncbi:MAG TPA: hypothetical protein VMF06_12790 [Candidatus Limnocylindria bacterium]|nr:hypothetical protein [Candidatus Limnocylindria bacterium]